MAQLKAYSWPGNVRELENVIERATILSTGPVLEIEDGLLGRVRAPAAARPESDGGRRTLAEVEGSYIEEVLRTTNGVIGGPGGAARILGLNPSTLRSRMQKFGIRSDSSAGAEGRRGGSA